MMSRRHKLMLVLSYFGVRNKTHKSAAPTKGYKSTKHKTTTETPPDLVPKQAEGHRVRDVEGQRLEVETRLIKLEVDAPARVLKSYGDSSCQQQQTG